MADEEILEEINESTVDPEAEKGFDEDETDGTDKEQEDERQEDAAGESDEGKEPEEEKEVEDEKEAPKEKTAAERAAERAERFKEEKEEKEYLPERETPKEKENDRESSLTKEQIKDLLSIVPDDELPGEIVIGNETVDLKALKEAYPDDFNSIKVLSGIIAKKIVRGALENGEFVKASDVEKQMRGVNNALATYAFWDEVREVHPDAKKIAKTPDFIEWVGRQSKHIQGLYSSADPEDAISLLDFYKEDMAKKTAEEHDKRKREEKKKKDGLHSDGVRTKPSAQRSSGENDKNDIQAGFEEEIEEQSKKK